MSKTKKPTEHSTQLYQKRLFYLFGSVDGSYGEGIVLLPTESTDILLELDIVDILSLSENGEIYIQRTSQTE